MQTREDGKEKKKEEKAGINKRNYRAA